MENFQPSNPSEVLPVDNAISIKDVRDSLAKGALRQLISTSSDAQDQEACASCHTIPRRRIFEVDGHHRVFSPDMNWKFREPTIAAQVDKALNLKMQRFIEAAPKNPVYSWIKTLPQVASRGALSRQDTLRYGRVVREMIIDTGEQLIGFLKQQPGWAAFGQSFKYAVTNDERFFEEFSSRSKKTRKEISLGIETVKQAQAARNFASIRQRNKESIAYALHYDDKEAVKKEMKIEHLYLNKEAIGQIGPAFATVVGNQSVTELSKGEVDEIIGSVAVVEIAERKARAFQVLKVLLPGASDVKVMSYLSLAIKPNTESGGRGRDLLDVYKWALTDPSRDFSKSYMREKAPSPLSTLVAEHELDLLFRKSKTLRDGQVTPELVRQEAQNHFKDYPEKSVALEGLLTTHSALFPLVVEEIKARLKDECLGR